MMARTFLSRRSLGEGGCSMRITEDVRKFAAEQKLSEEEALRAGMEQKALLAAEMNSTRNTEGKANRTAGTR